MSETEQSETRKLRPAQLAASTLAALTGAFLAARLGLYGTVVGVGVMSLLSTVGTELYIQSLERTKQAAKSASVKSGGQNAGGKAQQNAGGKAPQDAGGKAPQAAAAAGPDEADRDPGKGGRDSTAAEQEPAAGATATAPSRRLTGRLRWSLVAAGTVVAFVLAMAVITGIETVSGTTLSGAQGSTVGKIVTGDDGSNGSAPDEGERDDQDPAPTDDPTEPATDPTEPDSPADDQEAEDEGGAETPESPSDDTPPLERDDGDTAPPTEDGNGGDDSDDDQPGTPEQDDEPETER